MRRHEVDTGRLRRIIGSFDKARVTVIGDVIVDHYIWGRVRRISPEAPVPVVEVQEERRLLGGAANVAHNIRSLGGGADLVGLIGNDEAGDWTAGELATTGVNASGLVKTGGRPTSVKTRVIAHSQQVVRFDREEREGLTARDAALLTGALEARLEPASTVVVSDYGKGVVGRPLLGWLRKRRAADGFRVLVDPKSPRFSDYRGFTLLTPNQREAEVAAGTEIVDEDSLKRAGFKLLRVLGSEALLVTRGEAGMNLFTPGDVKHICTTAREVYDVTGAGDTVLAVLSLALAAGASFLEAAILANLAAGVVVGKVGTSTVDVGELLNALANVLPYEGNEDA